QLRQRDELAKIVNHPRKRREQYIEDPSRQEPDGRFRVGDIDISAEPSIRRLCAPDSRALDLVQIQGALGHVSGAKVTEGKSDYDHQRSALQHLEGRELLTHCEQEPSRNRGQHYVGGVVAKRVET